jgi:hypothetical protein
MRNIGSSIGISVVVTQLARNTQANHAAFSEFIQPFSMALKQAIEAGVYNLSTPQGLVALNAEVTRQAATLAYLQDFRLMMWIALAALPLILLLRPAAPAGMQQSPCRCRVTWPASTPAVPGIRRSHAEGRDRVPRARQEVPVFILPEENIHVSNHRPGL